MKGVPRAGFVGLVAILFASVSGAAEPAAPAGGQAAQVTPDVTPEIAPLPVDPQDLRDANRVSAVEIRTFVNDAKERDYVSKMKLHTFNEEVLKHIEPPGGARLVVTHHNEMNGGFKLLGLAYAIDGSQVYAKLDLSGALDERAQIPIFDAKVIPGDHQVAVQYDVGSGSFGVLSYVENFKIVLRRTYSFKVEKGKETRLVGTLATDDNITALFENRPVIGFQTLAVEVKEKEKPKDKATGEAADATADRSDAAEAPAAAAPPADASSPASGTAPGAH
jgi:hypothetical protein